jgi:hypothetical protein
LVTVTTPTFIPPEAIAMPGYSLMASPTLYPGQRATAAVSADAANTDAVDCELMVTRYGSNDELVPIPGEIAHIRPGDAAELTFTVPSTGGQPIASVGVTVTAGDAVVYLDRLTWDGTPDADFARPTDGGTMWRRAWVDALDDFSRRGPETYRLIQNEGRGLLIQGTREWRDYQVSATVTPHMAESTGIAARVQGLRRYYALLIGQDGEGRLVKQLDGERVLGEFAVDWQLDRAYALRLSATGNRLEAFVDGRSVCVAEDVDRPLDGGAVALVLQEGQAGCDHVRVAPPA